MNVSPACLCVHHMHGAHMVEEMASNPLEPELGVTMGAGWALKLSSLEDQVPLRLQPQN